MSDDLYPVLVYIYDRDGMHNGSVIVREEATLEQMFSTVIGPAIQEKREVRITDMGDLMVFHSYNGCIKYDGMKHHECSNCKERRVN